MILNDKFWGSILYRTEKKAFQVLSWKINCVKMVVFQLNPWASQDSKQVQLYGQVARALDGMWKTLDQVSELYWFRAFSFLLEGPEPPKYHKM